jgi:hypothetical protein
MLLKKETVQQKRAHLQNHLVAEVIHPDRRQNQPQKKVVLQEGEILQAAATIMQVVHGEQLKKVLQNLHEAEIINQHQKADHHVGGNYNVIRLIL